MLAVIALSLSLLAAPGRDDRSQAPAVPLPVSAFRAAQAFLAQLEALDKPGERLQLERLDAKRLEADKDHVERARVVVDLVFAGTDPAASAAASSALAKTLKDAKSTIAITTRDLGASGQKPTGVHLELEYDPAKDAAPKAGPATNEPLAPDAESFVRKSAAHDKVEVGNVDLVPLTALALASGWIGDGLSVRSSDKDRALQRLKITNFATVLERNPRASVTALVMEPPAQPQSGCYRMRLEVYVLRPAPPEKK